MTDTNNDSTTQLVDKLTEPQPDPHDHDFPFRVTQHKTTTVFTCCPETALDIAREIDMWETVDYSSTLLFDEES